MTRVIAIICYLSLLYSGMEMYQLTKIGTLIGHFSKHQRENSDLSFLDLLVQHYTPNSSEENDSDKNDDRKLPFKSIERTDLSPFIVSEAHEQTGTPLPACSDSYSLPRDEGFDNAFSAYIFRPPDMC